MGKSKTTERQERLLVGQPIIIRKGKQKNRYAVITDVTFASLEDEVLSKLGTPESRFAEIESYTAKTRDENTIFVDLTRDQFEPIEHKEFSRYTPPEAKLDEADALAEAKQEEVDAVGARQKEEAKANA